MSRDCCVSVPHLLARCSQLVNTMFDPMLFQRWALDQRVVFAGELIWPFVRRMSVISLNMYRRKLCNSSLVVLARLTRVKNKTHRCENSGFSSRITGKPSSQSQSFVNYLVI